MSLAFRDLHWSKDIRIKEYLLPQSLPEALEMLDKYQGNARVVAGGTDVISQLRHREYEVDALVDITRIPGLSDIHEEENKIFLGGLVTHAQVASSPIIHEKARLLSDGAVSVGSPQIRNIATVAGNLVSAQPAADTAIPLLALDAKVTIASSQGERVVRLTEFFVDLGQTVLDCTREILTSIEFEALGDLQGGCYQRLSKRRALTLPMLVCGVVVTVDSSRKVIEDAAIALGPVAPVPYRETQTEALLRGAPITRETVEKAMESASAQCSPRESLLRGSCDYRQEMTKVFVKRGLKRALEQAGCKIA